MLQGTSAACLRRLFFSLSEFSQLVATLSSSIIAHDGASQQERCVAISFMRQKAMLMVHSDHHHKTDSEIKADNDFFQHLTFTMH
jgi:hypothetical protein